eukprot:TRINITY_DN1844_c0_g2_i1.p1 TRINITY_DN1844_c0_g2~~TRINITY_DN1844_c0_g2_i1.p1  ORF type:complete len:161 (+),score=36.50 TRINITY_DN1844_c0_g2_i1:364-846(+)
MFQINFTDPLNFKKACLEDQIKELKGKKDTLMQQLNPLLKSIEEKEHENLMISLTLKEGQDMFEDTDEIDLRSSLLSCLCPPMMSEFQPYEKYFDGNQPTQGGIIHWLGTSKGATSFSSSRLTPDLEFFQWILVPSSNVASKFNLIPVLIHSFHQMMFVD